MNFLSSLPDKDGERYFRVIREGGTVLNHADLLRWLQGEFQHYLPHDILLAIWGNGKVSGPQHDLVSALPGVRTAQSHPENLLILQQNLYGCWVKSGKAPFERSLDTLDFPLEYLVALFGSDKALQDMRSLLVHGISDARTGQDCLYAMFSSNEYLKDSAQVAMGNLIPCLDTAFRRVKPLPAQPHVASIPIVTPNNSECGRLSAREIEVLLWVKAGMTNSEIGSILLISAHTVKNHLQRIYKKLGVFNRVQAASK